MPLIKIDAANAKRLHKDLLAVMKAAENVVDRADIQTVRQGIMRVVNRYDEIGLHIKEQLEGLMRAAEANLYSKGRPEDIRYWQRTLKVLWDFVHQLRSVEGTPRLLSSGGGPFEEPDEAYRRLVKFWTDRGDSVEVAENKINNYIRHTPLKTRAQAETDAVNTWLTKTRTWRDRVLRYSRDVHKWLGELDAWSKKVGDGEDAITINLPDSEIVALEGFKTEFQGFALSPYQDNLPAVRQGLKKFRELASKRAPIILKRLTPIIIQWTWDPRMPKDAAAYYEAGRVYLTPWVISNVSLNSFVKTMAHEMGHHIYQTYISSEAKQDWERFIRSDYKDLDLRDAAARMRQLGARWFDDRALTLNDPILSLQLQTLHHGDTARLGFLDVGDLEKYIAEGNNPKFRVPTHPITGYASKNPEEAFCEALGIYTALGPRAVLGVVKMMLFSILGGGDVREASAKSVVALYQGALQKSGAAKDWSRPEYDHDGDADRVITWYQPAFAVDDEGAYVVWYGTPKGDLTDPNERDAFFAWAHHNLQKSFSSLREAQRWVEKNWKKGRR